MVDCRKRHFVGRMQVSEDGDGKKIRKLAEDLHSIYQRFGEPDYISFLDGGIHFSWGSSPPGLDRYEEIPVDPELLHHLGWTAGSSSEIHIYLDGDELVVQGSRSEVRARVYDLASPRQGPRRRN